MKTNQINPSDISNDKVFTEKVKLEMNKAIKEFKPSKLSDSTVQLKALESFATTLIEQQIPLGNIELYSPVLSDNIVFKVRITAQSERATKYDISHFYVDENEELKEEYLSTASIRQASLLDAFTKIYKTTKCFIPFDKFNLQNQLDSLSTTKLAKLLDIYYTNHKPISY